MSAWGLSDNTTIAGTVTTFANTTLLGSSTYFSQNLNAGDYITISGVTGKNQVQSITSNTALVLEYIPKQVVTGKVAFVQQGPKAVHSSNAYAVARQSNVLSIENIYGVDAAEVQTVAVGSVSVNAVGAGYQRLSNVTAITANTTGVFTTTGAVQPQQNATASLTFTNNVLSAITLTNQGAGYAPAANTIAVTANTTFVIATTGASQPSTNATATINYTAVGQVHNAIHSGWVHFVTYNDAFGNPRVKSEVLVALSKNGITGDDEDVKFPD